MSIVRPFLLGDPSVVLSFIHRDLRGVGDVFLMRLTLRGVECLFFA